MAGISPSKAGAEMLDTALIGRVEARVREELAAERGRGQPLKAAFQAVARRLGITPRRVRAYHNGEVRPDQVSAAELLIIDARYRAELAALVARLEAIRGLISGEEDADALGGLAPPGVAARGGLGRGAVEEGRRGSAPAARMVKGGENGKG
jgi:hypothetical protein